jgi:hypothetical protein
VLPYQLGSDGRSSTRMESLCSGSRKSWRFPVAVSQRIGRPGVPAGRKWLIFFVRIVHRHGGRWLPISRNRSSQFVITFENRHIRCHPLAADKEQAPLSPTPSFAFLFENISETLQYLMCCPLVSVPESGANPYPYGRIAMIRP